MEKGSALCAQEGGEGMVEKAAKRLEVLQRRQERELAQLAQFEAARRAMQAHTPMPAHARTCP
jgi:hypothetical protein